MIKIKRQLGSILIGIMTICLILMTIVVIFFNYNFVIFKNLYYESSYWRKKDSVKAALEYIEQDIKFASEINIVNSHNRSYILIKNAFGENIIYRLGTTSFFNTNTIYRSVNEVDNPLTINCVKRFIVEKKDNIYYVSAEFTLEDVDIMDKRGINNQIIVTPLLSIR